MADRPAHFMPKDGHFVPQKYANSHWGDDHLNGLVPDGCAGPAASGRLGRRAGRLHWTADGIAVGAATLFDRSGPLGTGVITAVTNPAVQIDSDTTGFQGLRI